MQKQVHKKKTISNVVACLQQVVHVTGQGSNATLDVTAEPIIHTVGPSYPLDPSFLPYLPSDRSTSHFSVVRSKFLLITNDNCVKNLLFLSHSLCRAIW
jgi:hypothetical protein